MEKYHNPSFTVNNYCWESEDNVLTFKKQQLNIGKHMRTLLVRTETEKQCISSEILS
jgi:hypothetical protein